MSVDAQKIIDHWRLRREWPRYVFAAIPAAIALIGLYNLVIEPGLKALGGTFPWR